MTACTRMSQTLLEQLSELLNKYWVLSISGHFIIFFKLKISNMCMILQMKTRWVN